MKKRRGRGRKKGLAELLTRESNAIIIIGDDGGGDSGGAE
jgi:hypothetical protein